MNTVSEVTPESEESVECGRPEVLAYVVSKYAALFLQIMCDISTTLLPSSFSEVAAFATANWAWVTILSPDGKTLAFKMRMFLLRLG